MFGLCGASRFLRALCWSGMQNLREDSDNSGEKKKLLRCRWNPAFFFVSRSISSFLRSTRTGCLNNNNKKYWLYSINFGWRNLLLSCRTLNVFFFPSTLQRFCFLSSFRVACTGTFFVFFWVAQFLFLERRKGRRKKKRRKKKKKNPCFTGPLIFFQVAQRKKTRTKNVGKKLFNNLRRDELYP